MQFVYDYHADVLFQPNLEKFFVEGNFFFRRPLLLHSLSGQQMMLKNYIYENVYRKCCFGVNEYYANQT